MASQCACGREGSAATPVLGCLECGTACCPACAVPLESVTYCRRCARSLLEAAAIRPAGAFELH